MMKKAETASETIKSRSQPEIARFMRFGCARGTAAADEDAGGMRLSSWGTEFILYGLVRF
jgi:hypothetical protein